MSRVLNLLLTHQAPSAVERMVRHWEKYVAPESILLAYGGTADNFTKLAHRRKFYVEDPRLRTRDHQREFQSYSGIFHQAATALLDERHAFDFVHFAEYDHLPLVADLNARQIRFLEEERADLLGYHVQRIDGTSHPHYLYHLANPDFLPHWAANTRREEPEVILSMFGSGSFWTRDAFCEIAHCQEPFPIYMEVYLPTVAHHLGFRVRDFGAQNKFVTALGERSAQQEEARAAGAWTLHPVKKLWTA